MGKFGNGMLGTITEKQTNRNTGGTTKKLSNVKVRKNSDLTR